MREHGTSYGRPFLKTESRTEAIETAIRDLTPHLGEFDAIAFRGMSGALIAPEIARRLNKGLIMVRKQTEDSHSSYKAEGLLGCRYVIVDDMIASGDTVKAIQKTIRAEEDENAICPRSQCVGLWMHRVECYARGWMGLDYAKREKLIVDFPATQPAEVAPPVVEGPELAADGPSIGRTDYPMRVAADKLVAAERQIRGYLSDRGPVVPILFKREVADSTEENKP